MRRHHNPETGGGGGGLDPNIVFYAPLTESYEDVAGGAVYERKTVPTQYNTTPIFDGMRGAYLNNTVIRYPIPQVIVNYDIEFTVYRVGNGSGTSANEYFFALYYGRIANQSTLYRHFKTSLYLTRTSMRLTSTISKNVPQSTPQYLIDGVISNSFTFQNNRSYNIRVEMRSGAQRFFVDDALVAQFAFDTSDQDPNGAFLFIGGNQNIFLTSTYKQSSRRLTNAYYKDFKITRIV